jgi:hypothetical protein
LPRFILWDKGMACCGDEITDRRNATGPARQAMRGDTAATSPDRAAGGATFGPVASQVLEVSAHVSLIVSRVPASAFLLALWGNVAAGRL